MSDSVVPAGVLPLLLLLAGRDLAAQNDTGSRPLLRDRPEPGGLDGAGGHGATPDHLPFVGEGPSDADERAVVAHFVVTAEGRVDTSTLQVEHTADERWIDQLRRTLAGATYHPARLKGCPVARCSTFAVWARH